MQTKIKFKINNGKHKFKLKTESLFLLPSLLGVILFFIAPFGVVIYYSFINNPIQNVFVFLENYKYILNNSAFRLAVQNTAAFSLIAVPLTVVLSLGLAVFLEHNIPGKSIFRTFFLSPIMVPVASVVLIWQVLFNYSGPVNDIISLFGAERIDWLKSIYAPIMITTMFIWKNIGFNMILFMAALNNIPKTLLEVAKTENAGPWFIFTNIKLRYLSPTILFVTLLTFINSFKVFREVHLLTGNYPYDSLYTIQHFMNNAFNSLDYQKLATVAILMAVAMIIVIGTLFAVDNHFGKDVEG